VGAFNRNARAGGTT